MCIACWFIEGLVAHLQEGKLVNRKKKKKIESPTSSNPLSQQSCGHSLILHWIERAGGVDQPASSAAQHHELGVGL